jgi:23S rRNA pseudouridine1911/1915/1917 synthase
MVERLHITVPDNRAGDRLDKLLADEAGGLSRSRIQALLAQGQVSRLERGVRATVTEASSRVKPGESYEIRVPEAADPEPRGEAIALDVLYEDADLIVVDKPAGLVVHPAPGNFGGTLVNALIAHCGDSLSGIGGVRRPGIVHRLDKDTSGVMVAAKTDLAHAGLAAQFAAHSLERAYRAVVWGALLPMCGEITGNIGRNPRNRLKMAVVARGGKTALTRYQVLERLGETASLVECRLATGRTHQIRVHMAHAGHPLVGDPLYGRARKARRAALDAGARDVLAGFKRQALHACRLGFRHPVSGRILTFDSALPYDMEMLIHVLRGRQRDG